MKSLKSFTAKKRYDLTVFNHAAGNSELLVINDIALSSIEKKWFENIFRQCKDSVIGFALKKSPRFLDECQTLDDVLTKLEAGCVRINEVQKISNEECLVYSMHQKGLDCYKETWANGDGRTRLFIKVSSIAEVNCATELITRCFPELKEEYFHIGNNCLWIFGEHLYREEMVTRVVPFINRQKAAKLLGCNEDCMVSCM